MPAHDAIALLRQVINSPDCEKMNRSTVKGFLGELLVKERFEREGAIVTHKGNQSGFDLVVRCSAAILRIDVKMSLPKEEYGWGFPCWGWALQHERKQKPITATHFVCVGCSKALDIQRLFVVSAVHVDKFPQGIRQFSKVTNALVLPVSQTIPQGASVPTVPLFATCAELLSAGVVREVGEAESLASACA
jgi:hypothetical protein